MRRPNNQTAEDLRALYERRADGEMVTDEEINRVLVLGILTIYQLELQLMALYGHASDDMPTMVLQ